MLGAQAPVDQLADHIGQRRANASALAELRDSPGDLDALDVAARPLERGARAGSFGDRPAELELRSIAAGHRGEQIAEAREPGEGLDPGPERAADPGDLGHATGCERADRRGPEAGPQLGAGRKADRE